MRQRSQKSPYRNVRRTRRPWRSRPRLERVHSQETSRPLLLCPALLSAQHTARNGSSVNSFSSLRVSAKYPPSRRGIIPWLECRMVANRFCQCRLQIDEALVEGRGVLAVQGDHLGTRLTSADDLEGILLD